MTTLIQALATGLYLGHLPKAPGTWGTLLAFPLHLLLVRLFPQPLHYFAALVVFGLVAVLVAGSAEKIYDYKDPGLVVIDEIMGMLIGLIHIPPRPLVWVLAFFLFRFFDIWKPFPIRWVDRRVQGGVGIVLDDVLAGLLTLACIQLLGLVLGW